MRIALLSSFFYPHVGGTEKYVEDLATELARRGHTVAVFTNTPANGDASAIRKGFRIVRLPTLWGRYQPLLSLIPYRLLSGFDVVHSHLPPTHFAQAVTRRLGRVPHIVTYHCDLEINENFWIVKVPHWVSGIVNRYSAWARARLLGGSDRIIATSASYAKDSPVLSRFEAKIIPIGVDVDKFLAAAEEVARGRELRRRDRLLYVGRLAPSKGIDHLIGALAFVRAHGLDVSLQVVGGGELLPRLKRTARSLGVEEVVSFSGELPFEALVHAYLEATALVLPSVVRIEAFGIVQLEALVLGTPVIASDLSGVREVVERSGGGYLFEHGNWRALAETITHAFSNREETRRRAEAGKAYVRANYTWRSVTDEIERLYHSAIAYKGVVARPRSSLLRVFES